MALGVVMAGDWMAEPFSPDGRAAKVHSQPGPGPAALLSARPGARLWWLDDDRELCRLLAGRLRACGWRLSLFHTPAPLLVALERESPDLLLLDRVLPGLEGTDLLAQLRRQGRHFPVLMLSGLGSADQRIEGLSLGANDYLPKPFRPQELVWRIERLLQAQPTRPLLPGAAQPPLPFGGLELDPAQGSLRALDGGAVTLSRGDVALLLALLQAPAAVLDRHHLARATGSLVDVGASRSLDVRLSRLRRQLEQLSGGRVGIEAVRGEGYRLRLPPEPDAGGAPLRLLLPSLLLAAPGLALGAMGWLPLLPGLLVLVLPLAVAAAAGWLQRQVLRPLARLQAGLPPVGADPQAVDLHIPPLPEEGLPALRRLIVRLNALHAGQASRLAERDARLRSLVHDQRAPLTRLLVRLEELSPGRPVERAQLEGLAADLELLRQLLQQLGQVTLDPLVLPGRQLVALEPFCERIALSYGADRVQVAMPPLILRLERDLLHRVLNNLIDNALDHGRPPVLLTAQLEPDAVVLEVQEQGQQQRLPAPHLPLEGGLPHSGLGLSLVVEFCKRHGGRMELERAAAGGLRVRLRLGRSCLESAGDRRAAAPAGRSGGAAASPPRGRPYPARLNSPLRDDP